MEQPILLKLDLQGHELEALRGASATLQKTEAVVVETAFAATYEGEPTFHALNGFLDMAGFGFDRALNFARDTQGTIFQMDALFTREAS